MQFEYSVHGAGFLGHIAVVTVDITGKIEDDYPILIIQLYCPPILITQMFSLSPEFNKTL
jgi:hypothetical protein